MGYNECFPQINGEQVFTLEYNRYTKKETLLNADGIPILIITHNEAGLPIEWRPNYPMEVTNATYDPYGRMTRWQRGLMFEAFFHDVEGRLISRLHTNNSLWSFGYGRAAQVKILHLSPNTKRHKSSGNDLLILSLA